MKHISTTVTETAVHMRYADAADAPKYWIDFQVPLGELKLPAGVGEELLGDPEKEHFAAVRQAALRFARELIGGETQRLAQLRDRGFR